MNSTALEAILDVAIGMIFMWLVLSIATMSIQEWIASYLKWRAKDLEIAVQRLLGNEVWAEKLYEHPLIRALSKKTGKRPSYMPANKFALALYDVVMSAGTPGSIIQDKLLAARHELDIAPNQIGPLIVHLFKRLRLNLGSLLTKLQYFFGAEKGTQSQRFDVILSEVEKLFHPSAEEEGLEQEVKTLQEKIQAENDETKAEHLEEKLEKVEAQLRTAQVEALQEKLKSFILTLLNDQVEIEEGKKVPISAVEFFDTYPAFQKFFYQLLDQTNLRQRWAEILVNSDEALIEEIIKTLPEGMTYRRGIKDKVLEKAQADKLNKTDLESLFNFVLQSYSNIDFEAIAKYLSGLAGGVKGFPALSEVNPVLHKSLEQLYGDIIGIANNTKMMEAVRDRFASAAVNLEKTELNLAALRLNSETWFNESMDRLSGWYKRKATFLAFLIGLALATVMNVDSITLAQHLWREPAVRDALVANATEFANENSDIPKIEAGQFDSAVEYFNTQFKDLNVPFGWVLQPVTLGVGHSCRIVPIGRNFVWGFKDRTTPGQCNKIVNAYSEPSGGWHIKTLGIILTAAAAAQGSPFWFDILKKLVNVRGAGANPEEKSQ